MRYISTILAVKDINRSKLESTGLNFGKNLLNWPTN